MLKTKNRQIVDPGNKVKHIEKKDLCRSTSESKLVSSANNLTFSFGIALAISLM